MEAAREIEAKRLKDGEIELYDTEERLVGIAPREIAVQAILRGEARLVNPSAIKQVPMDEYAREARRRMAADACKANEEASRKWGSMR